MSGIPKRIAAEDFVRESGDASHVNGVPSAAREGSENWYKDDLARRICASKRQQRKERAK